jgi:hypothetical protein
MSKYRISITNQDDDESVFGADEYEVVDHGDFIVITITKPVCRPEPEPWPPIWVTNDAEPEVRKEVGSLTWSKYGTYFTISRENGLTTVYKAKAQWVIDSPERLATFCDRDIPRHVV